MTVYVALLRAVNVGGTGKLPMTELKQIADDLGFAKARTFIASGNLLFESSDAEANVRSQIEGALAVRLGKPFPVMVRTDAEIATVAAANPFRDSPGNRVIAIFLPDAPPKDALEAVRNREGERLALGTREIYVDYCGPPMGRAKLVIPSAAQGTARNMNTVAKLADLAREMQ